MAEYYPLLDRAISALTDPTAEARRSVYDRARSALVGQLRRMDPPVPEDDIARESAALDEAIARTEVRFDDAAPPPRAATPTKPASDEVRPAVARPARSEPSTPAVDAGKARAAPPRVPAPPLPTGKAPPVVAAPSRERPAAPSRAGAVAGPASTGNEGSSAAGSPRAAVPPQVPAAARTPPRVASPRGVRPVMALRPASSEDEGGLPAAGRLTVPSLSAEASAPDAGGIAAPSTLAAGAAFADVLDATDRADAPRIAPSQGPPVARARDSGSRPPAPRPSQARRFGWPVAVAALLVAMLMIGIGAVAYKLRDRPEQVIAARSAAPAAATPGKAVERASPATASESASEPDSGAAVPSPVAQGPDGAAPSIAVAQRAALLVDAPDDPQRVKTYTGTVVWRTDSVSQGGQPLATAVKADIEIPDAHLKITMLLQKNPEPQLPASHTIEFHFLPQAGYGLSNVKQINVPEMRKDDEAPTGEPLSGVPVTITDNYFLVGLSRGGAETQNVRLMKERNWFDMSVLFTSGKIGKLTFEKGAAGARVLEDALKSWK